MSTVASSQALAVSPYGRPNAMTCVAHGVIIDAPTNVPISGEVLWQAEVQSYNTATSQWEAAFRSPYLKNVADSVFVTAGPWYDSDGNTQYSTVAAMNGTGRLQIRVYNHFWRADQGQWVYVNDGWFSTLDGTATGQDTCVLDNGPIVV
ncbi:hypothetical protein [Arthrobacter globiformis]|uniref:hypothetical protein n=1 Tax=Arthrobacter globiformis TaxID=1665 RepID=UPI0027D78B6C|nr:hypothetical protein [Arthrobacter globiformis]